ncbi:hypothetical protein [Blastococcus deserti]|uniref:MYXO-CTERM domain-containing protein n=1 Tax=Blastococcus deserti TaxID=2259033 RepID=A0ABW4X5S9_9ACTN
MAGRILGARSRGRGPRPRRDETTYYATDAVVRQEPFALYWPEMRVWWLVALVLGSVLGPAGAGIRRSGVVGLVAGLVGAAVEMIWLPRWPVDPDAALEPVRWAVWAAAAVAAGLVLRRFLVGARPRPVRRTGVLPT